MRRRNKKYIFFFIASFLGLLTFMLCKDTILFWAKVLITSIYFTLILSFLAFLITIWHKIKFKEIGTENFRTIENIKELLSGVISLISDPSIFICSVSILKGLFLDYFFTSNYFYKFNDAEKMFLLIASFSFFIRSFIEIKGDAIELFFDTAEIDEPLQSNEAEA